MTSELVDLTGYLNIKKPLLTWLRIFSQDDNKELNNLNDGVFLNKVWCEINDLKEEDRTSNKSSDDNSSDTNQIIKPKINKKSECIKNLNNLIVNLKQFYEQVLGQFLVLKLPDIFRIAYSTDNELVNNDLNTLILLLLGSAVQCDKKEYFIEKIKQLNLDDQHELVDCIQQITDNPISVWSINEWSDLNLLPQNEHEKMFNLLFLHVQNLIQERDLLLERLVTIVIKLENLNEQKCDCSKSTKELNDEMLNILNFSSINRLDNQLNNLSIINNNINLTNLTINQSFHHSTPSKSPFHKLDTSQLLNNSLINKNCPNCRSLLNESILSNNKLDKKTEIDDSSLQSLQSLSSLTKEDDSEINLKLKQTIEELNEFKQKLRSVQTELEEKTEMIAELKELLEQSKDTCVKLREENLELAQEARSSKAYRDEVDILNEKVRTFHHLENELQKYKLKMNEFDFYKARVDEYRDENRLLSDAKQMLEEQLELSRKKCENFNEIENQLYQLKAYSSELKTQRELDKDKIQNLIEKIASLQVEKKQTIEELSVCQRELKHLRSQLNNSQIYLNDYNNKLNNQGTNNNNDKLLNHNDNSNNESIEPSEETSLELMINTNLENEKNLRSSLLEQLNSDASKRILKLELENQKLKFIIENNLRTNNNTNDNNINDNKNELINDRRKHSSSISSLGSVHSDESKEDQLNNNNNNLNNNLNKNKSNQLMTDRLGDRCSSNSSTDSIKSTSLSVFSNTTNSNQLNTNQFNSPSTSPLDNNEYDSGCVSLICENNHNINNKSNSITPINMLRMQQQQQQLDKERLQEVEKEEEILNCNKTSQIVNQLNNNQLKKTINNSKINNNTIKEQSLNKFNSQQLNDQQLNQHLDHSNKSINNNNLITTDINSNNTVNLKSNNLINQQHLELNYRSNSESSSNCDDEHQLNRLRLFNGSSSSLSSNASSNIGLKQQQQQNLTKSNQTNLNKLNNSITLNTISTGSPIKNRNTADQIKQIDIKRMPLMSTSQIESELEAESYLPVNYTTIQLKDNLKIKSPKYQIKNNQLIDSPPRLPPRNPISSTTSSCSSPSSSNSPLTIHTNNKQLVNGKLILNKNETIQSNKSTIENKYAFNFLTKSSCTVNNSLINSNSNTCTIRQTTSTYNNCNPTTITVLNGSNLNGSSTGFSSSIITTTTTTQCLNQPQRKITNNELITNEQSKDSLNNSPNNFVRGVFRSCNVNFGPNFKSQKFVTNTKTTPVTTLNNSLNTTGLTKTNSNRLNNGLNEINSFNRQSLRAETLNNKTNKLINKAIQQNGYILTKQLNNQSTPTTKNDHKINDITTSNNFNYLTNSVSSPSLNSSESDDDEYEETDLQRLNTTKTNVKQINKSSPNKLNNSNHLHNSNNLKSSMQIYQSPLQRSKTLMLNSNGKPFENHNNTNRPQRIEITTTHHHPNSNCQENRSLVSSPVSTVSSKSVWYEYGCV